MMPLHMRPKKNMASGVLNSLQSFSTISAKMIKLTSATQGKYIWPALRQTLLPVTTILRPSVRNSNFRSSAPVESIDQYPQVEVLKNPPEWKYVERILRKPLVPEPQPKSEYPSGWRPQTNLNHPYFVARTKNYMIPVYMNAYFRGTRRITKLRRVQGDIWLLERELRQCIEKRIGKSIATRVNELSGQIWFRGDYCTIISEFLMKKGL